MGNGAKYFGEVSQFVLGIFCGKICAIIGGRFAENSGQNSKAFSAQILKDFFGKNQKRRRKGLFENFSKNF